MAELSVYERKVGSFSKPYAFVCAKEMKPSAWWAMFGKYVQVISSIAQRVLPQPVVRGRCGDKYNRSIYGSIKMKGRSRLDHCHDGDKMVYVHEMPRLMQARQTAHYKPPVATWHESSDEETDEEDLNLLIKK
jgi:hypothetical protein